MARGAACLLFIAFGPQAVTAATPAIGAGVRHSIALGTDGRVGSWGDDSTGTLGGTATARSFSGNWWSFGGGQTLTGAWKPSTRLSDNVDPVTIQFSGPDSALMTLPNSRIATLGRHRF